MSLPPHEGRVKPDWIDSYGHMNMAMYVQACDGATGAFWDRMNDGRLLAARRGAEYAVVETHVNYLQELSEGEPFHVQTQLISCDEKRFRIFHTLSHGETGVVAATNEVMALGFDLGTRRLRAFDEDVQRRLQALLLEHAGLPLPENAGRAVGMPRRRG